MKRLTLFLLCFIAFALQVFAQSDIKLEIGAKLPRKYISGKERLTLTAAAQTRPFIEKTIGNVDYIIAFDEKTRKIKYIHTMDEDFRTSSRLKVDDEITFTREELEIFPYWEIRAPATPDGWFPVIASDMPMAGGDFIAKLKKGEKATMTVNGFSKGSN